MNNIGKNIRQIRTARKMRQEELADALFVTRQTISNYETGRSNPDVETLTRIAVILETDVNTLIYGPPVSEEKKASYRRLYIAGGILILLAIAYAILLPPLKDMAQTKYYIMPLLLLRITLRPGLFFFAGRFMMLLIAALCGLKQKETKITKVLRITMLVILGLLIILPLPYIIWGCVGLVQFLSTHSVAMTFPKIPLYTTIAHGIIWLHMKCPFFMSVIGMLLPLKAFPKRKTK